MSGKPRLLTEEQREANRARANQWYWSNHERALRRDEERRRAKGVKKKPKAASPGEVLEMKRLRRLEGKDLKTRRRWDAKNREKINDRQRASRWGSPDVAAYSKAIWELERMARNQTKETR
jgi:hypothetical protein